MRDDQFDVVDLLRGFFSECERHFRFLEQQYGYSFFCGLIEYKNNYKVIKPLNDQRVEGSFLAVTRYEKDDKAIELAYSQDQFSIEGFAFYNSIHRFELFEILSAARKSAPALTGDWGVTDTALIHKTIEPMAQAFEQHARILLDPNPKILERALTIRHTRLEQNIRQRHTDILKSICEEAAKAFREKNYLHVIHLLEPHKHYLKKAEIKKLERSKEFLQS